jgi:uncharacterized protein (TIGR02453 family)
MAFQGWPIEAVEFYEGLEADNSKVYWQDNKAVYDRHVKAPMEELLAELADEFGTGKIFRPYRDVRFSADKTPFKTNCAATIGSGYVSFSAEGLSVGGGLYMPDPKTLARYREAVDKEKSGAELATIVAALHKAGYETMAHDVLKTAPRGYPKDHPRIDLLRHKGIAMMKTWPVGAWLGTKKAKDRVVETLRAGVPLNDWLARHVG